MMTREEEFKIRKMMKEKKNLELGIEYIANLDHVVVFVRDDNKNINDAINVMYKENDRGGIDTFQLEFKSGDVSSTIRAEESKLMETLLHLLYRKNHLMLVYVNHRGDIHSLQGVENAFGLADN